MKAAVNAGKHVLCEKPFTTDLREADELLALLGGKPELKVQLAFNHRRLTSYYHGFTVIRRGEIGRPLAGYARKNDTIWVSTEMIFLRLHRKFRRREKAAEPAPVISRL